MLMVAGAEPIGRRECRGCGRGARPGAGNGTEWGPGVLRAGPGPAGCGSTENRCLLNLRAPPGSHPPAGRNVPRPRGASAGPGSQWRCAWWRTAPDPVAYGDGSGVPRSGVQWWTRPNLPVRLAVLSTPVSPGASSGRSRSGPGCPRRARARTASRRERAAPPDHSGGRTYTVSPPTTVRRQTGRSAPGVRSGSPGVPERGSVDQRATRSSGAWTRSSSVRQSA